MNKMLTSFLDKVVWKLLVLFLTPIFAFIGSKLQSGSWLTWLNAIPFSVYIAFFALIGFWFSAKFIIRRLRNLKDRNLPFLPSMCSVPPGGYTTIGTIEYQNVKWRVQVPASTSRQRLTHFETRPSHVDIATPPYCPKCDTELEETETFFGRYRWKCLRCGFYTKSKMSFYHEAVRAKKLAQSHWE